MRRKYPKSDSGVNRGRGWNENFLDWIHSHEKEGHDSEDSESGVESNEKGRHWSFESNSQSVKSEERKDGLRAHLD